MNPIRDDGPARLHPSVARPVVAIDLERPDELDAVRDVVTRAFGALVGRALAVATAGGWPLVLLEGDPHFYGRRGFAAAEPLGFPSPAPQHIPPGAYQVALLPDHEPWMTGTLVSSAPSQRSTTCRGSDRPGRRTPRTRACPGDLDLDCVRC
ncbi:hypothetical protein [Cellulomonas sp. URHB0016]